MNAPVADEMDSVVELRDEYIRGRFCFVLGAGASKEVGVPLWGELTREVAVSTRTIRFGGFPPGWICGAGEASHEDREQALRTAVIRDGSDLPWLLSALKPKTRDLREVLYRKVPNDWTSDPKFVTSALCVIATLTAAIALQHRKRPFHVITYNFDTLLEEAFRAIGLEVETVTPSGTRRWGTNATPVGPVVKVAHPHGVLYRPGEADDGIDSEIPTGILLDAEHYDSELASPLANHRLWQLSAFAGMTCLFYGWSFQDYAVRPLLRMGAEVRECLGSASPANHVALLVRRKADEKACLPPSAVQPGLSCVEELEDSKLENLGVTVLRTSNFDEQKEFLQRLVLSIRKRPRPASR